MSAAATSRTLRTERSSLELLQVRREGLAVQPLLQLQSVYSSEQSLGPTREVAHIVRNYTLLVRYVVRVVELDSRGLV